MNHHDEYYNFDLNDHDPYYDYITELEGEDIPDLRRLRERTHFCS
jgi:hypothetical protein